MCRFSGSKFRAIGAVSASKQSKSTKHLSLNTLVLKVFAGREVFSIFFWGTLWVDGFSKSLLSKDVNAQSHLGAPCLTLPLASCMNGLFWFWFSCFCWMNTPWVGKSKWQPLQPCAQRALPCCHRQPSGQTFCCCRFANTATLVQLGAASCLMGNPMVVTWWCFCLSVSPKNSSYTKAWDFQVGRISLEPHWTCPPK